MQEFALFPLNTRALSGGRLPLRIFEHALHGNGRSALRDDTPFGVCLIRDRARKSARRHPGGDRLPRPHRRWDMPQLGMLHIIAGRAALSHLGRRVEPNGLARASIETLPDDIRRAGAGTVQVLRAPVERVIAQQAEGFSSRRTASIPAPG